MVIMTKLKTENLGNFQLSTFNFGIHVWQGTYNK